MPREPMSIVINTAVATSFSTPCTLWSNDSRCERIFAGDGARFEIDYVRVYHRGSGSGDTIGCSPDAYPTKDWIEGHAAWYGAPAVSDHKQIPLLVLLTLAIALTLAAVILSNPPARLACTNCCVRRTRALAHALTCSWIHSGTKWQSNARAPTKEPLLTRQPPPNYTELRHTNPPAPANSPPA
jgi:hypothetical protein